MAASSTDLSAAAFPQVAAAASSQALAGASNSTIAGSEVGILAQIITVIGVLPIEVLIVTIVLGVHRFIHRRSPRSPQTRAVSIKPRRYALPFLQAKAELEDEQKRMHELHGEHLVRELGTEDEIFQMPDETENLVLPLQGKRRRHEMPGADHVSWEMPLRGRCEAMGDDCAGIDVSKVTDQHEANGS